MILDIVKKALKLVPPVDTCVRRVHRTVRVRYNAIVQPPKTEPTDLISKLVCVRRSNAECVRHLITLDFKPATVIDVGVAFGTHYLYELFPEARHVLVEPIEEFKLYLQKICSQYWASYVIAAASDEDGQTTIRVTPDLSTSSVLEPMNANDEVRSRTVKTVRLDTLCKKLETTGPYVIKVDTQGYELIVLKGAADILEETEVILLEVSLFDFSEGLPDFYEVISYMKNIGFAVYDLFDGHNRPLDFARAQIDVVFVKENGLFRKNRVWGSPKDKVEFIRAKFEKEIYRSVNPDYASKLKRQDS